MSNRTAKEQKEYYKNNPKAYEKMKERQRFVYRLKKNDKLELEKDVNNGEGYII